MYKCQWQTCVSNADDIAAQANATSNACTQKYISCIPKALKKHCIHHLFYQRKFCVWVHSTA